MSGIENPMVPSAEDVEPGSARTGGRRSAVSREPTLPRSWVRGVAGLGRALKMKPTLDAISCWSTAITRFYPAWIPVCRQRLRLLPDRARTWFRFPFLERRLIFLRQLCSILANGRTRRILWRYCVIDVALGVVSYVLYHSLRLLPLDTCSALGGGLGLIVGRWRRINRPDAHARKTFARLRPESAGKADLDAAMNRMCANIGCVSTEYSILDLLWAADRITVSGHEHLANCRRDGRPIIVFGVHLSNWEVIGAALLGLGYAVCTLYKPTRNRFQDRIANEIRMRGGAELVPPGPRGARQAYRALTDRRCLFLTWVDEAIDGCIRAPAFGRPISRRSNLAAMVRLARATGAQTLPAFVERQSGARFLTTFGPPVELVQAEDDKTALLANLQRLDGLVSSIIVPRLEYWRMLPAFRFDRLPIFFATTAFAW
jgi:Kdo2-lipid IVA lauroyltransferase/acyltransferase